MNDQATRSPITLPELSDDTIARMETDIFQRIDRERGVTAARSKRKRSRTILLSAAAATVVVAGAAVVPSLINLGGTSAGDSAMSGAPGVADTTARTEDMAAEPPMAVESDGGAAFSNSGADTQTVPSPTSPQVITTASISLTVADVEKSAAKVTEVALSVIGYVSSQNIGSNEYTYDADAAKTSSLTSPTYGWITIRVPDESVDEAIAQLEALGTVTATTIDRYDVTQQSVDLQARVSSLQASVARLEDLMSQSGSVADLITAEAALSERQAELESLQQQLDSLRDQVAMSTISVNLVAESEPVDANPDGFSDGIAAGWNGLIAAMNGIIIALGFALPWLVVIAVIALIIWLIVRARRPHSTRGPRSTDEGSDSPRSASEVSTTSEG